MLRYLAGTVVIAVYTAGVFYLALPDGDCDTVATINIDAVTQKIATLPFGDQLEVITALESLRMNSLISGAAALNTAGPQSEPEALCKAVLATLSAKGLI